MRAATTTKLRAIARGVAAAAESIDRRYITSSRKTAAKLDDDDKKRHDASSQPPRASMKFSREFNRTVFGFEKRTRP